MTPTHQEEKEIQKTEPHVEVLQKDRDDTGPQIEVNSLRNPKSDIGCDAGW